MCSISSQRAHRLSRSGPSTRPEPKASCKPRRRTRKRNAPSAIAVVDFAGDLLAFERMDGVRSASAELAIETGRTAARLQRPTQEVEDCINHGRTAFVTAGIMSLRGGMPISAFARTMASPSLSPGLSYRHTRATRLGVKADDACCSGYL
jgi:Haem degrading protein HbpS-like